MKKMIGLLLATVLTVTVLTGCSGQPADTTTPSEDTQTASSDTPSQDPQTDRTDTPQERVLKVAALESAYGAEMWNEIKAAFEAANEGVTVALTVDKNIEDVISPAMKAGDYPDVVHLAVGRPAALTETLIKENALEDISDVLSMNVPGENIMVKDKIVPGFTDTLITNPYNDGKTYLAPMFYSPCGLFYNAGLFESKGWDVPTTWDEMWALGDIAAEEGIALFTYPTAGYFDAFFYALLNVTGGSDLFNNAMLYSEGVWNTPEAQQAFDIVGTLATYTEQSTPANANNENYLKNQQLILDNKALFMPNGTWVTGEMADAPRADGFKWGFTALPAVDANSAQYSYTFFEQVWVPAAAENKELAKLFISFLYSDEAAGIFAGSNAIQPIVGISSELTDENVMFYSIYNQGAKASMGGFAATEPVEGVSMADALLDTVNSLVSGDKTQQQWVDGVKEASDALRKAMK